MIPGNVDPRRPDKVQRYKPEASGNGNAMVEDLTPDYMNILGPDSTTGNVQGDNKVSESIKNTETKAAPNQPQQQQQKVQEDTSKPKQEAAPANTTNASNVIPTSPQYGVAIIPTSTTANDIPTEGVTAVTDTLTDSTAKTVETEIKDIHSTPSKNDRFKVVKIASSEPFRRGRWKCMDYVDQTPSVTAQQTKTTTQGTTGVQMAGNVYMQTQSLPPHQIQQLLMQGGFTTVPPQFFQGNLQSQLVPQAQYFYPAVQNQGNVQPQQIINPTVVPTNSVQPQFINPGQQTAYFAPAVLPQNFPNLQFVQQAAYQGQSSAFVPTTQNVQNFQQAQTYAGQPTVNQQNVQTQNQTIPATQPQPMVNGFAYSPQNISEQHITASNLPTQVAKNVLLNSAAVVQNQVVQNQSSVPVQNQQESQQNSVSAPRLVPIQNQQLPEQNSNYQQQQQPSQQQQPQLPPQVPIQNVVVLQAYDPNQPTDVYTNPQFVASVHSLPAMDSGDIQATEGAADGSADGTVPNPDDLSKTNPVVNAIDNKIEQAMDLVKSHLMYTVREEVEVLKEKIAELMERIQQLESENNFLRSQIPKNNPNSNGTSEPSPQQ